MPQPRTDRVEAVLFDYGGVLRMEPYEALAAESSLPPSVVWSAFHDLPEYIESRRGRLPYDGYRAAVVRELARHLGAEGAESLLVAFEARGSDGPFLEPRMAVLLDALRGRVRLSILSNAGAGTRQRLEARGVARAFDDVLCSGEIGLAKPDPAVFLLAAERLDVAPHACAFVDDLAENCFGARTVGMRAHHYVASRHDDLAAFLEQVGALRRAA